MSGWDPNVWFWGEALEMLDRAERLQRQFFRLQAHRDAAVWLPPVDVFDEGNDLFVVVALPDVPAAQVEVVVEAGGVVVRGERPLPQACRRAQIRQLEIPYGRFERRVALPGAYELVRRGTHNGCLVLNLRRLHGGGA